MAVLLHQTSRLSSGILNRSGLVSWGIWRVQNIDYRNDLLKLLDRQALANSADSDQTAKRNCMIRI